VKPWDKDHETGLRFEKGIKNVEYHRDIRPILARSCVACHSHRADKPAGGLVLDDDDQGTESAFGHDSGPNVQVPRAYFRLAGYGQGKPRTGHGHDSATRYVHKFQSRRSLLIWKLYGKRTDGTSNDDFPSLSVPGDPKSLHLGGKPVDRVDYNDEQKLRYYIRDHTIDLDYTGSVMPPPEAVKSGKVAPLSDEDRRTFVRWIDLGCPIDLDPNYDPKAATPRSHGWMGDDQRPTLTLTHPQPGANPSLSRLLIGMHDAYTGLDRDSFQVRADFPVNGLAAGANLAAQFQDRGQGVWELKLERPLTELPRGKLTVVVKDRQGNTSRIERVFSVVAKP
jgi:hypothetical protein